MTPCVKRYYFLYFSHPHPPLFRCPGHFATRRSIICRGRILCMLSGTRRRCCSTVLRGTAQIVTSHHATQTSVREEGNRSAKEWNSFKFITGYTKITEDHPRLFLCFVLVFSRAIVNYSPFPALSSRPHVRRHQRLGERKLAVLWV